jgi:hypothetical protein
LRAKEYLARAEEVIRGKDVSFEVKILVVS